jgi:hypothetical protein
MRTEQRATKNVFTFLPMSGKAAWRKWGIPAHKTQVFEGGLKALCSKNYINSADLPKRLSDS